MVGALLCPPLPRRRGAAWRSSPTRPSPPAGKHYLRKGQHHCLDLFSVEAGVASTEPDEEGGEQDGGEEKPQAGDQLHLLDAQPVHGPELSLSSRKHLNTGCMYIHLTTDSASKTTVSGPTSTENGWECGPRWRASCSAMLLPGGRGPLHCHCAAPLQTHFLVAAAPPQLHSRQSGLPTRTRRFSSKRTLSGNIVRDTRFYTDDFRLSSWRIFILAEIYLLRY